MFRRRSVTSLGMAGIVLLWASLPGWAQTPAHDRGTSGGEAVERKQAATPEPALPSDAVTTHTIKIGDREFSYTATAGALALTNDKGEHRADVFFVAYTLNGADAKTRPLTIAFNGGPGAGSAYLQLGAIGPRILDFGNGKTPFAPGGLIDNPDTWLDVTDLVFVDPVGTGYSRGVGGADAVQKEFWGVRQDLDSLGQIVRLALAHLDRFSSPLYLAGESYGGFRAARLPKQLADGQGLMVRGEVMVSPVLEFSLLEGDDFRPMPWALRLPSYAAVSLEAQGKLTADALKTAETFALGEYLTKLVTPPADAKTAERFYGTIADLIGLPESLVARWRGRVPLPIFTKERLHDQGELVSRYDGSVATPDPYPSSAWPASGDPILSGLTAPLTSGFVAYVRDELHFKTDRRYVLLNGEVARRWDMKGHGNGGDAYAGASNDLREGLALNPRLRVLIAHGMTDLQTPYMASRYVIDHLPAELTQGRVTLKLYPGGHMMYLRQASRAALHQDVRAIYSGAE